MGKEYANVREATSGNPLLFYCLLGIVSSELSQKVNIEITNDEGGVVIKDFTRNSDIKIMIYL